jgi:small subunit ribosomal protein S5
MTTPENKVVLRGREINLDDYEKALVSVRRTSKVVKGGKRFTFNALVVVGNRNGEVGWGYGKANEVPLAVEKAIRNAPRTFIRVPLVRATIPHTVWGKAAATRVLLKPACSGTGIKAGLSARAVLEMAGIRDVLSKVFGSTNPLNVVKATHQALSRLRTKKEVETLRGVRIGAREETA